MSKTVLLKSAIAQACTSEPMRKPEIPVAGTDARMQANTLAAEVMAHAQVDSKVWLRFAWRIIDGTTDMRAQFEKVIAEMKRDMRKVNAEAIAVRDKLGAPDVSKSDTQYAGGLVSSALNRVSALTTIAHAFNSGGTIEDLLHSADKRARLELGTTQREHVGFETIYAYAKPFSASKAGPKVKGFLVKLEKWLEEAGKPNEASATYDADVAHHATIVAVMRKLQG